jgi:nitrate reductase gamma subunit
MESWIEFAKGPLFAVTFLVMVLGLARHVLIQVVTLVRGKGRRLRAAPWRKIFAESLGWAFPVKHLIKGTIVFSSASFIFHIGAILVPVFLADHIVLWEGLLGVDLPSIGRGIADVFTLLTIACLLVLLACRLLIGRLRAMSRRTDYVLLLLILVVFTAGFMASHPGVNFLPWSTAMLIHLLSAELLFVLVPFTKLAHIVLFAFDRMSALHWQLRPGAGDQVANALFGKEARV